jgi:hypothetical protein
VIDSLRIRGFKLFRDLALPKLARLNLFVGTNNVGKSCLLEAVRLYIANGNPVVLRELVHSRDGDWEIYNAKRESDQEEVAEGLENPIRFLFSDFHYKKDRSAVVEIGPINGGGEMLRLSSALYRRTRKEDGSSRWDRVGQEDAVVASDEAQEMLEIYVGGNLRLFSPDRLWSGPDRPSWLRRNIQREPNVPEAGSQSITIVGTGGIGPSEVSFLWDQVSLTPYQEKILSCLGLIGPKIEALTLVGDSSRYGTGQRVPVARIEGNIERFPLRSMGDGLTRLFHIALAMVNAQHGVILIDEFENGLYWEVLEQVWPVIFKMAEELDVQVFATTHSRDCVNSFVKAWSDDPSLGTMYRLERTGSTVKASPLPLPNLRDALASNVEVR